MKTETEFLLDRAVWPAVVMLDSGMIVRANLAAYQEFGPRMEKDRSFSAFWSLANTVSCERFLATPDSASALNIRLHSAGKPDTEFASRLARMADAQGRPFLLLQLFKTRPNSAPAAATQIPATGPSAARNPAPAGKAPEEFLLEEVEWPALLVDKTGKVLRANRAAVRAFGSKIQGESGNLSEFWPSQTKSPLDRLLTLPPAEPVRVALQLKSGLQSDFLAQFGNCDSHETCLVQLLKAPLAAAGSASPSASAAPPAPAPTGSGTETISSVEAHLLQKQKLDCALQLARSVALDFNNALTSILGHTSLLLSKAEADHPWRNSLVEIEKSAAKAAETASDLAAFSRQEKDARQRMAGNLNTLLERTVEAFRRSINPQISVAQNLEAKLFTANFDEAKMQQALVRILENAVEAMHNEGRLQVQTRNLVLPEPTQDCSAKLNAGNYVCAEISDTGKGIAPDVLPRIFEPFFTTKGGEHRGLGLAWVYGIVTNHGGSVAVSSTPGLGTSVRVYLPANRKFVRETPVGGTDLSGKQTILLVDDEDLILTMGQMVLTTYGYTVLTANNAQKALELFNHWKQSIGLIVTDLVMPGMSGRELTEQILRIAPHSRIVWTSGYVRASDSQESAQYLQKPFTSQELLRKVKQALS
jgi:signal transduction histidine kinase/CheY-like chemotaxis protein